MSDVPEGHAWVTPYLLYADAHCDAARSLGATIATEPETASYGGRRYAATDLDGHHWWFATSGSTCRSLSSSASAPCSSAAAV